MSLRIHEFTARRLVWDTPLAVDVVIARLNEELNKEKGGLKMIQLLRTAKNREELEQGVQEMSGGKDFVEFISAPYHNWRNAYNGATDAPKAIQYIFGNPIFAENIMKHDSLTALNIPLRLLVTERADRTGTQVVYLQPSTIIAIPVDGNVNTEVMAAAKILDAKVEKMVRNITAV